MNVAQFAEIIVTIRRKYKGSVTSWGRSDAHAVAVGGFAGDPHTWDLGVDMVYDSPPGPSLDADAHAAGLKVLHEKGHDHYQPGDFPAGPVHSYGGETR